MYYGKKKLTPIPLTKRHMRHMNNPSGPSTNLFTKENARRDNGTMTPNGSKDALKRSSGYQTPHRFLRHLITVQSEILPTIAAPTGKWFLSKIEVFYEMSSRTDISDTCRYKTSADHGFIRNFVTDTLKPTVGAPRRQQTTKNSRLYRPTGQ